MPRPVRSCTATSARARRASDRPVIRPGWMPARSGWSSSQRSSWISTTSNSRSASRRWPQRTRSVSANSSASAGSSPSTCASGSTISGGRARASGFMAPPSKSSVAQVNWEPSYRRIVEGVDGVARIEQQRGFLDHQPRGQGARAMGDLGAPFAQHVQEAPAGFIEACGRRRADRHGTGARAPGSVRAARTGDRAGIRGSEDMGLRSE